MTMETRDKVLNNGFEQADYSNKNKIAWLYIITTISAIFAVVCLCLVISLEATITQQERQIKDRDSLNATLRVTNDTINHKLLPIGE